MTDRPSSDNRTKVRPTPSQTVGPFFHFALAADPALGRMAPASGRGERVRLVIRVIDGDGLPVPDALLELYQADADGRYPSDRAAGDGRFYGFGRLATDVDGICTFDTIRPGVVVESTGRRQARHVNVCLFARGLLHELYTRIYFDGDPDLSSDALLALVPEARRRTLIASSDPNTSGTWAFDIHLQGEHETVFFAP